MREIEDRSARIEVQSQIRFLELAGKALKDDALGFNIAREFDLREIGLLYYVLASSSSLSHALVDAARYSRVVNEGILLRLAESGPGVSIGFVYHGVRRATDRHQIEFWLTTLIRICRQLTNTRVVPLAVRVNHHRGASVAEMEAFFSCKVEFGAAVDEIVIARRDLESTLVNADRYLHDLLKRYCEEALAARQDRNFGIRHTLENLIAPAIPVRKLDASAVAREMGMSRRTLMRRLAKEGVSFSEILSDLKFDLAKRYLEDEALSISQIAWLLGYSESSAFTHAFYRWSGRTPRQWRMKPPAVRHLAG